LRKYLDNNGCLFVGGDGFMSEWPAKKGTLMSDYMFADGYAEASLDFTVTGIPDTIGNSWILDLRGSMGSSLQQTGASITAVKPPGEANFLYDRYIAGIQGQNQTDTGEYKTILFSYDFSSINSMENRTSLMRSIVDYLACKPVASSSIPHSPWSPGPVNPQLPYFPLVHFVDLPVGQYVADVTLWPPDSDDSNNHDSGILIVKSVQMEPEIITITDVEIIDEDEEIIEIIQTEEEVEIEVSMQNLEDDSKSFVSVVQVVDQYGIAQSITTVPVQAESRASTVIAHQWEPHDSGVFKVDAFLLDDLDSPEFLGNPAHVATTVNDRLTVMGFSNDGSRLSFASVEITDILGKTVVGSTDSNGRASFGLLKGIYQLEFNARGHEPVTRPILMTEDALLIFRPDVAAGSERVEEPEIVLVGDFSVRADASRVSIAPGEAASLTIYLDSINGFESSVDLNLSSLPNGIEASFSADPVQLLAGSSASTIVTFEASEGVLPDTYSTTLVATATNDEGTVVTHELGFKIEIIQTQERPSEGAPFELEVPFDEIEVARGEDNAYEVILESNSASEIEVDLYISYVPPNVEVNFDPDPIRLRPGEQDVSELQIQASESAETDDYNVFIVAQYGNEIQSVNVQLVVTDPSDDGEIIDGEPEPVLQSISIQPQNPTVEVDEELQFTATGHYDDGSTADLTGQVSWISSDDSVLLISTSGLAHGLSEGSAVVTASIDDLSAATEVTVSQPEQPTLTSITISPSTATAPVHGEVAFEAVAHYSDGSQDDITYAGNWTSSNTEVAVIDSVGVAQALSPGTSTIMITFQGLSANAELTVLEEE
jgi:hypothetical protein